MALITDIIDLGSLGLKPGGGTRFDVRVPVGDFIFSDQHYKLSEDPVPVKLDFTRTTTGYVIRVRATDSLNGPCMRCYGDYSLPLAIDHSEVHEPQLEEPSDYVSGTEVNVAGLVRDAIGLSIPTSISSPVDENGVCIYCENAGDQIAKAHDSEPEEHEPDPRWAKLRELEL